VTSATRPSSRPGAKISEGHIRADQRIARGYRGGGTGNHLLTIGIPGVHIETIHNPIRYTYAQIEQACKIAAALGRGKLILAEPPRR